MSYMVVLTFDIHNGDSEDYETVTNALAKKGLVKHVTASDNERIDLPENTYVGTFTGSDAREVAKSIREWALDIFKSANVHGQVFVMAGADWGWASKPF